MIRRLRLRFASRRRLHAEITNLDRLAGARLSLLVREQAAHETDLRALDDARSRIAAMELERTGTR